MSRSLQHGGDAGPSALRTPAGPLEKLVGQELASRFDQPLNLLSEVGIEVPSGQMDAVIAACASAATDLRRRTSTLLRDLVARVEVGRERIEVKVETIGLSKLLRLAADQKASPLWTVQIDAQLRRSGKVMRYVQADGSSACQSEPHHHLMNMFRLANGWWDEMLSENLSVTELAARRKIDKTYVSRVIRLRFLSPRIVEEILCGEQPPSLNARRLLGLRSLPLEWKEQESLLLSC